MNLLCPACHTPLPATTGSVVSCPACSAEVDVTGAGTIAGRPRFVAEVDRSGTTLAGYRIGARLGGGGMGTVYRATTADGTEVAMKLLAPALAQNPALVSRFAREITTLARLDHPAIVRVLAHGSEDGIPWFAMELVSGSDLRARLARGALARLETAAIFARLLAALEHAHQAGIVHRDLKPANVLLAPEGARLADFGVARWDAAALTGSEALTRLTETAAVIGTLPYMSPEQRRGGEVDRRSDLFSVGVMLYEAATGALPQGAFPPPSELNAAYGARFDRLVQRLLQPEPARRPASAEEAAAALDLALAARAVRGARVAAQAAALLAVLAGAGLGGRAWLRHEARAKADPVAIKGAVARNALPRPQVNVPDSPIVSAPDAGAAVAQQRAPETPSVEQLDAGKRKLLADEKRLKVRAQIKAKVSGGSTNFKKSAFPSKKGLSKEDLDLRAGTKDFGVNAKEGPPRKRDLMLKAE